jgi:hypothetical protein
VAAAVAGTVESMESVGAAVVGAAVVVELVTGALVPDVVGTVESGGA